LATTAYCITPLVHPYLRMKIYLAMGEGKRFKNNQKIKSLCVTHSINDTQRNNALQYDELHYAECHVLFIVVLSVVLLNVVFQSVVAQKIPPPCC
jgi:hypothetical protein